MRVQSPAQKGFALGGHHPVAAFVQIVEGLHQFPHFVGNVQRVYQRDGINAREYLQPDVALVVNFKADEAYLLHHFQVDDVAKVGGGIGRYHPLRVEQFAALCFAQQVKHLAGECGEPLRQDFLYLLREMAKHVLRHIYAEAIVCQGIEHLYVAAREVGMRRAERVYAVQVPLVDAADCLRRPLHWHVEHVAVEVLNLQRIGYLCVMHLGVLAREDTAVAHVVKQDVGFSPGAAVEVEHSPHHALYLVVVPQLDVKRAVGGNLHAPASFAVGRRMEGKGFEGHEVGIYHRSRFAPCRAGELEVDSYRVGLHLRLRREGAEGEQKPKPQRPHPQPLDPRGSHTPTPLRGRRE